MKKPKLIAVVELIRTADTRYRAIVTTPRPITIFGSDIADVMVAASAYIERTS